MLNRLNDTAFVWQSVTCRTSDMCLTTDPGVENSILAQYHTFMEIDHEITAILLPLIQERFLSVTSKSMCMKYWLTA